MRFPIVYRKMRAAELAGFLLAVFVFLFFGSTSAAAQSPATQSCGESGCRVPAASVAQAQYAVRASQCGSGCHKAFRPIRNLLGR